MKIVSWNCNGKFREKFNKIKELNADIYIIQECENPKKYIKSEYGKFAINYIWTGESDNKGLGIFLSENINFKENNWPSYCLRNFISININNNFDLVGVWACKPYIEEYYIYQNINLDNYNGSTIIMGDFNSNKIWDGKHSKRTHMNVCNELEKKGLISAYHYIFSEKQGKETQNTFYLYRHLDKGYHIDHCFVKKSRIKDYKIVSDKDYLNYSDHLPIELEII